MPLLRESFESKQSRKYKSNSKQVHNKKMPYHEKPETPEQFKNIYALIEDKIKRIQECKKKDRKKKIKFN